MNKISLDSLPWELAKSPSGKFQSQFKNISQALGGKKDIGIWGGGHPFDLQMRSVPPGARVCPFHSHAAQWEMFIALEGTATVRLTDSEHVVKAGDVFIQPPGTAHQIRNTGEVDFVFYVIADNPMNDLGYYPDSNKWMMKPSRKIFKMRETDYFDGEE